MDTTKGFVVPAGGGKHLDMGAPGRFAALKLVGHETNENIMLFEETVPVGTKSLFHLHRDSDEVASSAGPAPARSSRATSRMPATSRSGSPRRCGCRPRVRRAAAPSARRRRP